jgi:hypothetical protein
MLWSLSGVYPQLYPQEWWTVLLISEIKPLIVVNACVDVENGFVQTAHMAKKVDYRDLANI